MGNSRGRPCDTDGTAAKLEVMVVATDAPAAQPGRLSRWDVGAPPEREAGAAPRPDDPADEEDLGEEWRRILGGTRRELEAGLARLEEQDRLVQRLLGRSPAPRCGCDCGVFGRDVSEAHDGQRPIEPQEIRPSKSSTASTTQSLGEHAPDARSPDAPKLLNLGTRHMPARRTLEQSFSFLEHVAPNGPYSWFKGAFGRLHRGAIWLSELVEPERKGRLNGLVRRKEFELLVTAAIIANVVFTFWSTNDTAKRIRNRIDVEGSVALYVEIGFCLFFGLEVAAKLAVHRLYFFVNANWGWNCFDFALVASTIFNLVYDKVGGGTIGNVSFLRSFRMLRVTRILRMLRVLRFCQKLRQVLEAIIRSVMAVAWVIVLLNCLFLVFAMIFVQLVNQYLWETGAMDQCRTHLCTCDVRDILDCNPTEALVYYFGSVQKAMISLYMATTGGLDWTNLWDVLIVTGFWNAMFFQFFTFVFIFCIFNLLTGLFVNQALTSAQHDKDIVVFEQRAKEKEHVDELRKLCMENDKDDDGLISPDEFDGMMLKSNVVLWLAAIGLDIADAKLFFSIMQQASGHDKEHGGGEGVKVPIENFVQGCMRMRGTATSIDVQALMYSIQLIMEEQRKLARQQLGIEGLISAHFSIEGQLGIEGLIEPC